jgi:hypothetical protein
MDLFLSLLTLGFAAMPTEFFLWTYLNSVLFWHYALPLVFVTIIKL